MTGAPAPYVFAACQPATRVVFDEAGRVVREHVDANVADYCACIARAAGEHGAKLIAFPQFGLSGYAPVGNAAWVAAALTFPGREVDRIAAAARAAGAHVVIQAAERHAAFPGRYFLSAALLTPDGGVATVYRKHYTLSLRTSPIDVLDTFVEVFGRDAFFPVVDTPLGRIGLSIAAEAHWPEVGRSLALNGAEVVVNPVAAFAMIDYLNRRGAEAARGVRAFENMLYWAMANMAGTAGAPPSAVYDFEGRQIAAPAPADPAFTLATIDIAALRAARGAPGANLLAQIQPIIHAGSDDLPLWPANAFPDAPAADFAALVGLEASVRERQESYWGGRADGMNDPGRGG